jgi:molecular chaperone DnaJ
MSGEGESGFRGGPPGDLYVDLRIRPDPRFERDGDNLYAPLEISYLQAILGGEIEVETLRGKKTVTVPRACQYAQEIRLRGDGLPSLRGHRTGDLIFVAKIVMPKKLSKDEEKLLRQIAGLKGDAASKEKSGILGF